MSKILTDYAGRLLARLVAEERKAIFDGDISYGDAERNTGEIELLDEAGRALAGEVSLTEDIIAKLKELAAEERRDIHKGYSSYGTTTADGLEVAEELTEAIEALNNARAVTA